METPEGNDGKLDEDRGGETMSGEEKKLRVESIQTDHRIENEFDLGNALKHHNLMARLGGLVPDTIEPIEINLKSIKLDSNGKSILTIETKVETDEQH
jgi:hypothetical protein